METWESSPGNRSVESTMGMPGLRLAALTHEASEHLFWVFGGPSIVYSCGKSDNEEADEGRRRGTGTGGCVAIPLSDLASQGCVAVRYGDGGCVAVRYGDNMTPYRRAT